MVGHQRIDGAISQRCAQGVAVTLLAQGWIETRLIDLLALAALGVDAVSAAGLVVLMAIIASKGREMVLNQDFMNSVS